MIRYDDERLEVYVYLAKTPDLEDRLGRMETKQGKLVWVECNLPAVIRKIVLDTVAMWEARRKSDGNP